MTLYNESYTHWFYFCKHNDVVIPIVVTKTIVNCEILIKKCNYRNKNLIYWRFRIIYWENRINLHFSKECMLTTMKTSRHPESELLGSPNNRNIGKHIWCNSMDTLGFTHSYRLSLSPSSPKQSFSLRIVFQHTTDYCSVFLRIEYYPRYPRIWLDYLHQTIQHIQPVGYSLLDTCSDLFSVS